jgi:hypothetical protein
VKTKPEKRKPKKKGKRKPKPVHGPKPFPVTQSLFLSPSHVGRHSTHLHSSRQPTSLRCAGSLTCGPARSAMASCVTSPGATARWDQHVDLTTRSLCIFFATGSSRATNRVLLTEDGWFYIAISRCGWVSGLDNQSHAWVGPNQGDERVRLGQSVHGMGAWVLDLGVTGVVAASAGSAPLPV